MSVAIESLQKWHRNLQLKIEVFIYNGAPIYILAFLYSLNLEVLYSCNMVHSVSKTFHIRYILLSMHHNVDEKFNIHTSHLYNNASVICKFLFSYWSFIKFLYFLFRICHSIRFSVYCSHILLYFIQISEMNI